ncbi:tape measure protein [Leuconostoc mesenteroides]|uniref:tape measure protein n=1 Tax=Leuconostoc mesenteroides TaxID=1245 RepID=UPI0021157077|nr:tape measure protein [Leuconostoc mesenteroides]UUE18591.1 tape measure protein [Leuconostoc mesenteroides]
MADGSINIDLLLNDQTDKTWSEFKSKAETAGKGGYEKFKESFKGDPLVAKLEAQANKAGINNFKELLSKLPKEKRTELLAKAEKGEVVNYEKLLREIPAKVTSEVELNDNATTGLKAIKQQAERTGDKFRRLKDIMIGTFVANAVMGGVNAITNGLKEMTKAGMEYNKEQDTMKTVWTALTTEAPQDGKELVDYINNLSQHSIYAADNINEMAQSFYHVHSNVEETKKWTDAFVALGSTLHMTGPQISESGEMFAKIVAGGKASSEDMAVMINRFPMFGEALQKATGKSMKELYAMSAAGKLSATQFTEALDYLGEKYKGGTEEAMTSMQGMSMYLHSRLQVLSGEVMKSSFNMSKSATAALQSITSDDSMKKFAESIGSAMGSVLGGISKIITYIDKNKDAIIGIIGNVKTIIGLIASGVWETFKDTINLIGTAFGKVSGNSGKAADPLKTVNNLLEEIANHKSALKALGSVMVALFATKKIYGFIAGIDATVKSMKDLIIVQKIAGFMDSYKLAQEAVATGTGKLTVAQTALSMAFKGIPLVAIIGGIIAVGAAFYELYKHNEKFKGFVDGIVKSVGNAFGKVAKVARDLFNSFKEAMKPITDSLVVLGMSIGEVFGDSWKALTKAFKPFVTLFKSMFDGVGERISKLAKPFEELGGKVGKVFSSLKDSLKDLIAPFTHAGDKGGPIQAVVEKLDGISQWFIANKKVFTDIAGVIGKVLGAAFVALGAIIRGTFELIVPLVKPIFNILVATVKGTLGVISGLFKALGSTIALILDVITGNWKNVGKDVKGIVSGLGKIVTSILKTMVSAVGNIFHGLVKVIDKALWGLGAGTKPLESFAKTVKKIFSGIVNWFKKDWKEILLLIVNPFAGAFALVYKHNDKFRKAVNQLVKDVINLFKNMGRSIADVFNGIFKSVNKSYDAIKDFIYDTSNGIYKSWKKTWNNIFDFFGDTWNGMKKFGSKAIDSLKDTFDDVLGKIGKSFGDTWTGVKNGFSDMWDGMKKLAGDGINAVIKIPNAGIDGINGLIHDFGGPKNALGKIPKVKFANGTGAINQLTHAILNDGNDSPETGNKETLIHPNGKMEIVQGRNTERLLLPGTEVLNASETAMLMGMSGVKHFANGTGFLGSIWDGVQDVAGTVGNVASSAWDGIKNATEKYTKMFDFISNVVAHPVKTLENVFNPKSSSKLGNMMGGLATGSFKHVKNQATDWWKSLWSLAGDEANGGGGASELLSNAVKYGTGKPYVWGATGPDSFDCSGLVQYTLKQMGKSFPHYSGDQFNASNSVGSPKSGDLAFFGGGGSQHVGIYAGNGKMFSAMSPSSNPNIGYANISNWSEKLAGYHRVAGLKSDDEKKSSGNSMTSLIRSQVGGMFDWIKKFIAPTQDSSSEPAGDGVSRWTSDVKKALSKLGLSSSSSMVNKVLKQIQTESGGNAKAIGGNDGLADGNATGLMQVKPGTFKAYAVDGHNNIMNGYDNILAGLNYAKHRYGSGLSFLGQGHGYANGGRTNGIGIVGEVEGEDEWVTNSNRSTADSTIIGSIKETAQKQPNSFAAKLAGVINGAKSGMQAITSQQPIIAGSSSMQSTNGGIDLSGDVHMTVQLDSGEIARAVYPKTKILQNQEIQLKGQVTGNTYVY